MAAATAPRFQHLISKTLDPVFAILIGVSAACVRIHREEKAAGRAEHGVLQVVDTGLRRAGVSDEVRGRLVGSWGSGR